MPRVVGIHIGTAYSTVAVYENGAGRLIPDEHGSRFTPSFVAFTDRDRLIGEDARSQVSKNPKNTIYHINRFIGREFEEQTAHADRQRYPFEILKHNDRFAIRVSYRNRTRLFTSEEIVTMLFTHMKRIAENYLGETIRDVVITTPTSFGYAQRQAMEDAATAADLRVVRVINESTAAVMAYGLKNNAVKTNVLVFYLGGGSVDVSIVSVGNGCLMVKSTAGDARVGGEDFTHRLAKHFAEEDLRDDPSALRRLYTACEQAKIALSTREDASIEAESLRDGVDWHSSVTRAQFEELNADLFRDVFEPIEKALRDARMDQSQIDRVILAGGATRMPRIQKHLQELFPDKIFGGSIEPNAAVACGAAIAAEGRAADVAPQETVTPIASTTLDEYQVSVERTTDQDNDKRKGEAVTEEVKEESSAVSNTLLPDIGQSSVPRDEDMQSDTRTSLYIGNLHLDVTEAMLFDKFASVGPIRSIRVCRDMITRQSLGYAYVYFQQTADAERALSSMNFDVLRGRPLRIMWSQREPVLRESGVGMVSVKNLDKNIDSKSLYETFSAFGKILSCEIMTDEAGQSKGFGFVQFETQEAADSAINKVNGMLLADKKVFVRRFTLRNQRVDEGAARKFTNIFFKNFSDQLTEEELRRLFARYGKIRCFTIAKDENGHSKGYGFCSFENPEEAEEAVQQLNGRALGDKQLYVGRFQKKSERLAEIQRKKDAQRQERMNKQQGVNVYIKNLDDTIDDERLRREFSKFGTITSAKVMTENGRSKGFGFVCFSAPDEANKAVTEMNGSVVGSMSLHVVLAQRKKERRALLTNQQMQSRFPSGMPMNPRPTVTPGQMMSTTSSQPQADVQQEPLTPAALANASPQQQKQMLGERLFPLIWQMQPELAGKITGMLLELDNADLLHMLESRESLKAKVEEAIAVLLAHQAKQIYAAKQADIHSASS